MTENEVGSGEDGEPELTKAQISEGLNTFFGTKIDWTKFSKTELDSILSVCRDADRMCLKFFQHSPNQRKLSRQLVGKRIVGVAEKASDLLNKDRPIVEMVLGFVDRDI